MRLFIAKNFNDATKAKLLTLRNEIQMNSECGNFSSHDNLHLTLIFLGECDAGREAAVKAVMDAVDFQPFNLSIDRTGRFKRNSGDIWWAGIRESKALTGLHSGLTDKLIAAGFSIEKRKYSPHITLGREIAANIAPRQIKPFEEAVSSIELMKSERFQGKLTYTAIHSRKACDPPAIKIE